MDNPGFPVQLDGEIYPDMQLRCKIVKGGLITYKVAADRVAE